MGVIGQTREIVLLNLRSIPSRLGASLVIVVGIAGVVAVMVAMLSMSAGLSETLAATGDPDRVVVLRGGRVEEFDYESAARKQLRGNIYLAKVTRVEPSLQAAFVDYGGNRHGFLAFNEIHPDYYQIPMADRQALLDEEAAAEAEGVRRDVLARRPRLDLERLERGVGVVVGGHRVDSR